MPWWAWVAVALAYLGPMRSAAGHFAFYLMTRRKRSVPEVFDWIDGCVLALAWPVILGVVCAVGLLTRVAPKVGAERAAVLAAREQAVRQAERDLGIGVGVDAEDDEGRGDLE